MKQEAGEHLGAIIGFIGMFVSYAGLAHIVNTIAAITVTGLTIGILIVRLVYKMRKQARIEEYLMRHSRTKEEYDKAFLQLFGKSPDEDSDT